MFRKIAFVSICAAMLLAGCGTARVVRRTQTGGVLALEGDRNKAMEEAHRAMQQHCQGPYTILEEGEHVVGSDTAARDESYVTEDGTVVNEGGQSTREATEWRVRYECGANAAPQPGYQPGPAPSGDAPPPDQAPYEEGPPGETPPDQGQPPPPSR